MSKSKTKVNKSQAIRDYVVANPGSSAKDVVAALAKKKIQVTASMVASIKWKAGLSKKRGSSKGAGKRGGDHIDVATLLEAKKLVSKAGSVDRAIESLRVLQKLESL